MSLRRHVLQVVALVTAVALVFGAFAGSAGAKSLTKKQKAKVRAELRKQVKKNPGAVKRRSFLRKAALVNFKLPVTIRIRNTCERTQNQAGPNVPGGTSLTTETCRNQGTALNQRTVPSANVDLGPSLGTRTIALGGALAAVVEFADTYDGGALGNVNLKILPGNKSLTTSSVPLLWNNDISGSHARSDANFGRANFKTNGPGWQALYDKITSAGAPGSVALNYANDASNFVDGLTQGCGDWTTASTVNNNPTLNGLTGTADGTYKSLFDGILNTNFGIGAINLGIGAGQGVPGYTIYQPTGATGGGILPQYPGSDNPDNIKAGGVVGDNNWIGPNPYPFPQGIAPGTGGGSPATYGGAPDTVLRTNALQLGIATGGQSVDMSTGGAATAAQLAATAGGTATASGSNIVTMGYSGGQANLFGNIPGKNVGIDVTVNLETKINSIVRIMDQDVFKAPSLIEGDEWPAGIFNCRQIVTGAVQNYIPGVRLTGSLRIAPAITKDGKVRIAKATVRSDAANPDRVALSACLFPAKPYQDYTAGNDDQTVVSKVPTKVQIDGGGSYFTISGATSLLGNGNTAAPVYDAPRWGPGGSAAAIAPSSTRCGTSAPSAGNGPGLAELIRSSGLTGTVSGIPDPSDPAYAGINYRGDQASVAGDISVNPTEVDVLLGDQPGVN